MVYSFRFYFVIMGGKLLEGKTRLHSEGIAQATWDLA